MTSLPRPRAILVAFGALAALGLLAFLPGVALADNCSNLADCWSTAGGAAGAAVGIGVAAGLFGGMFGPPIPPGVLYLTSGNLRQNPSSSSPVTHRAFPGSRAVYTRAVYNDGQTYYYVHQGYYPVDQSDTSHGWVPASDTSSTRPPPPMVGRPVKKIDLDHLTGAKSGLTAGGSG
jgi:hypothetical protein